MTFRGLLPIAEEMPSVGVVDRDETYQFLIEEQVDRFLDGLSDSQAECRFVGHGDVRQRLKFQTKRLTLVLNTAEDVLKQIEQLSAEDRAQVSPVWLARIPTATGSDPWIHGFTIVLCDGGVEVGHAGFKKPPNDAGVVEIVYGIAPEHQGRGYATEAAEALTDFAFRSSHVRVVCAHTLPENNASARVLAKCGFRNIEEVLNSEDGNVWRWQQGKAEPSK